MIMERIYSSNSLEKLCQTLAHHLQEPPADVFAREVIITQSAGMASWLKTSLTGHNGILANFSFQNQDGFLSEVYQLLFGERPKNNSDLLKYRLFDLLGDSGFAGEFPDVAAYFEGNMQRKFQLAGKITDLFDQYQLYRPEMVAGWSEGTLATPNQSEAWQQWLWQRLDIDSRSDIRERLFQKMDEEQALLRSMFPSVSLFGITVFTSFHHGFFRKLAEITRVDFYICLPTHQPTYQNDLLQAFGTKAAELAQLFDLSGYLPVENNGGTSLARLQNQILNNETSFTGEVDASIQVNACYTPAREAEVLYNYLLGLLDKDRSLTPADILVLATDIDKYAPFVKAVFNNAPVKIPIQVSGASATSDDTIVSAVEMILRHGEEDMTSEKVVSLLEQKRIRQRFGIEDSTYIRSVVRKANIRFGMENRKGDDTVYVGWKYGLDKILLGYAMLTDEEFAIDDDLALYPFRDTEASASHDLFRLRHFVEILHATIEAQREERTLAEWKDWLFAEVIDRMVYRDDFSKDDRSELSSVYRSLAFTDRIEYDQKIPFAVFQDELQKRLFSKSRETRLNTGRVTVSPPVPVRGLPFRVICFLGLDNGVFPRHDRFQGFDLLGEEYRAGDRSKKEADKYLFLDTLMAAREKLFLSYIGISAKDNTAIPPSIVVDTLLQYLGQPDLAVKHPLHGYSPRYQPGNERLFTFLYGGESDEFKATANRPEPMDSVSAYSFVKFFENPVAWYFNNILGIRYEETDDTLPETELITPDSLQKWQVKKDLAVIDGQYNLETYKEKCIKEGLLPLKSLGDLTFRQYNEEIAGIREVLRKLAEGTPERSVAIDLDVDGMRIAGPIPRVFGRAYIATALSRSPEKEWTRAFLHSLLLFAAGSIDRATMVRSDGTVQDLAYFSPRDAKERITGLLSFFRRGMDLPLKFSLTAACPPAKTPFNAEWVMKAFKQQAAGNDFGLPPDPYMQVLMREGYFDVVTEDDLTDIRTLAGLLYLNEIM